MNSNGLRILRLYGTADLDHLDPVSAHEPSARQITRLFSRRLFDHRALPDPCGWQATTPAPDLATAVPSTYNAGLGASHRSYVVHLRAGVLWDTVPPRQVTAHDVVRGFKRLGNPVSRPRNLAYLTSTVRGLAEYCERYAATMQDRDVTPDRLAAFQNEHDIPGVFALDDESLVIELNRPALDAVNVLASACVAPAPVEYDAYLPGSLELRRNLRSTGPYRPAEYRPGARLVLERNPAWHQDTDPIRRAHADGIEITVGTAPVAERIRTGAADLPWGATAEATPIPCLPAGLDYIAFNFRRPAGADPQVRRAVLGVIGTVGTIIPPGSEGHSEDRAAPPAAAAVPPGAAGRPDVGSGPVSAAVRPDVRSGLPPGAAEPDMPPGSVSAAMHPEGPPAPAWAAVRPDVPPGAASAVVHPAVLSGLTLVAVYPDTSADPYAALEGAGVTLHRVAVPPGEYDALLRDGEWDLAALSRFPDWFHDNGRVFVQPLLQSDSPDNYGHYANPRVDRLIEEALDSMTEADRGRAAWRAAEGQALDDVAVVPVAFRSLATPRPRGPRVRAASPMPTIGGLHDLADVRLA